MRKICYMMILFLCAVVMASCKESELPFFINTRYIHFDFSTEADRPSDYYVTSYSFGFEDVTVTSKIVKIPVTFQGHNLTEGLSYSVIVDEKESTIPKECYELTANQIFTAGIGNVDSLEIKLHRKTEILQQVKVLKVRLVSNENFTTILDDCLFAEVRVDDIFGRPGWWNRIVEESYLGTYSEKKLRDFIELTGIIDFGELATDQKRHYALLFKRDLEANPREDENGKMTVPIVG